jgi:hypothetical protein
MRHIIGDLRVRILKALSGIIEGQPLSRFVPDVIYDVDDVVGGQLIVLKAAIEVRATDPAVGTTDDEIDMARLTGGVHVVPHHADDRPQLRPKPDRRKTSDRRKVTRKDRRS